MGSRLELHDVLLAVTPNVYFQPPASVQLAFPCIVYSRRAGKPRYANDSLYAYKKSYSLTVIDKNPDSDIPDKILKMPLCSFDRHFTKDNLNHDTYNLYY